jgi:hypothetical protein
MTQKMKKNFSKFLLKYCEHEFRVLCNKFKNKSGKTENLENKQNE